MKRLNEIVTLRHAAPLVAGNSIEKDDEIRLTGCGKSIFYAAVLTAAAKAGAENKPVIAALKRCATQNQVQYRVFPQPAKA
jgi:hypothetical protein